MANYVFLNGNFIIELASPQEVTINADSTRRVSASALLDLDTLRTVNADGGLNGDTERVTADLGGAGTDTKREIITRSYADKSPLTVHFFPPGTRISQNVLKVGNFKKGTANFAPKADKLVNRLWVKGGKAISDLYSQPITVGAEPIPLNYSPRSPVTVTVGGVVKTLGIQNITEVGTCDFLLNAAEKLLIPDLCTTGTGTISYKYEYPIKILLEEPNSQEQYGIFEDVLQVETDDKDLALELGYRHLYKYSQPIVSGSIEPFTGIYRPGDYVFVDIPEIKVSQYLEVKAVTYDSIPGKSQVDIRLQLETPERDLSSVLKDLSKRLSALEKSRDDEGPVQFYISIEDLLTWSESAGRIPATEFSELMRWTESVEKSAPINFQENVAWTESFVRLVSEQVADEETGWTEDFTVTPYSLLPAEDLYPDEDLYPM